MDRDPFKEYIRQVEPNKRDKGYAWSTAIGLQAVDGFKTAVLRLIKTVRLSSGDSSKKYRWTYYAGRSRRSFK